MGPNEQTKQSKTIDSAHVTSFISGPGKQMLTENEKAPTRAYL